MRLGTIEKTMKINLVAFLVLSFFGWQIAIAQPQFQHVQIVWNSPKPVNKQGSLRLTFQEAMHPSAFGFNAVYQISAKVKPDSKSLISTVWETMNPSDIAFLDTTCTYVHQDIF